MGGVFPLAMAVIKLAVMFAILVRLDLTLALLSLVVVPFLWASLRYYARRMVDRAERVKALESSLVERMFEILASVKVIKSFAREAHELAPLRRRRRRHDARAAAPHLAGIAVLGGRERDHAVGHGAGPRRRRPSRARRHAHRREPAGGHRLPGRRLQPTLVDCPHHRLAPAGGGERAAGARDPGAHARAVRRPGRPRRRRPRRRHPLRARQLRLRRPHHPRRHQLRGPSRRAGRARRAHRRRQDHAGQPAAAVLRAHGRAE